MSVYAFYAPASEAAVPTNDRTIADWIFGLQSIDDSNAGTVADIYQVRFVKGSVDYKDLALATVTKLPDDDLI